MQTGLLAFAIVLIVALVAAIAGPHLVDWTTYRPQFERELSRVLGTDVRIDGDLDARLLPSPSLSLRGLSLGDQQSGAGARAARLDIEFHLGSLLRGEWRAARLALRDVDATVAIGGDGSVGVMGAGAIDLAGVAVDRLEANGRVTARDTRSGNAATFDDVYFVGELRAASSSLRGEGKARKGARDVSYRISLAPTPDQEGTRLRASFDSPGSAAGPPLIGEAEGVFRAAQGPQFDGQVTLARPVTLDKAREGAAGIDAPWRVRAHARGDSAKLRLENLELHYGAEDSGLKLTGIADVTWGAQPRAQAVLSARQIDLDRLLARSDDPATPAQRLTRLARSMAGFAPPMPVALSASVDVAQIGARPVRGIGFDALVDARGWTIDKLELQAPGATQASLSGRLSQDASDAQFNGALAIDSADVAGLVAWLRGGESIFEAGLPFRANAQVSLAPERIAVENLSGRFRGAQVSGAVVLSGRPPADSKAAFAEADVRLEADDLDLAALGGAVRGAGMDFDTRPQRIAVDLRLARAQWRETRARDVVLRGALSKSEIVVDRLMVADAGGLALDGSGRVDFDRATGGIALHARAARMENVVRFLTPVVPEAAGRLGRVVGGDSPLNAVLTLGVARRGEEAQHASLALEADAAPLKARLRFQAKLPHDRADLLSPSSWQTVPLSAEGEVEARSTSAMLTMLGLEPLIGGGDGVARLTGSVERLAERPLQLRAELAGEGVRASVSGTASTAKGLAANLKLDVADANIAPLVGSSEAVPAILAARADLSDGALALRELDATIAGTRLRGRLTVGDVFGTPDVEGDVGAEHLSLGPLLAALTGAPRGGDTWSKEPFGAGLAGGWRGRIGFAALSADLGGLTARGLRGILRADGDGLHVEDLAGQAAGGAWQGRLDLRRTDTLQVNGAIRLDAVEAAQWPLVRDAMTSGRISAEADFSSAGRSPAALIGSVSGSLNARLSGAQFAALNPRVFAETIALADAMPRIDDARIAEVVRRSLASGDLAVPDAKISLDLRAGRVHANAVEIATPQANVTVNGSYVLTTGAFDARLRLEARDAPDVPGVGAPVVAVTLKGKGEAFAREVDSAAFTAWLTVRAVDRETRRLEALEKERATRAPPPAPSSENSSPTEPPPSTASAPPAAEKPPAAPDIAAPAPIATTEPGVSPQQSEPPQEVPPPPQKPKPRPQAQRAAPKPPPLPPPIELRPAPGLFR